VTPVVSIREMNPTHPGTFVKIVRQPQAGLTTASTWPDKAARADGARDDVMLLPTHKAALMP